MEVNPKQLSGLTDGSLGRRRRLSSTEETDIMLLGVVFNKKKQKHSDEVAVAIERLRENGVNCVLFTMDELCEGSVKNNDALTPDGCKVSSSTSSKDVSPVSSLSATSSLKLEVENNSNSSMDSNSSSNLALHQSVEDAINNLARSPSPPPLSPQLHADFNLDQVSTKGSLHELLSPHLTDLCSPVLETGSFNPLGTANKVQEAQICSTSSILGELKHKKRRRRRLRKPYTHRKAQLKKKLKFLADEAKAVRAAKRTQKITCVQAPSASVVAWNFHSIKDSKSDKTENSLDIHDDYSQAELLPIESREQISSSSDTIKMKTESTKLECQSEFEVAKMEKVDSSEDVAATVPDSSTVSRRKKGHRKKNKNGVSHCKRRLSLISHGEGPMSHNGFTVTTFEATNNYNHRLPSKSILKQIEAEGEPLTSLLTGKRAFPPDIIRGLTRFNKLRSSVHNLVTSKTDQSSKDQTDDGVNFNKVIMPKNKHMNSEDENHFQKDQISTLSLSHVMKQSHNLTEIKEVRSLSNLSTKRAKKKSRSRKVRRTAKREKKALKARSRAANSAEVEVSASASVNDTKVFAVESGDTNNIHETLETAELLTEENLCLGQDDDSVPSSVDSGLPSSENLSITDEYKTETGNESSGSGEYSNNMQAYQCDEAASTFDAVVKPTNESCIKCSDDSLPSTFNGMQLRRSSFYALISDNVRKNMDNYLDGRAVVKMSPKRRKRTKSLYLLNHGDNYPDDPETPYRLHMATQVLLKLNKRRAKCKPKEDRVKSLLSYLKLTPKRPPRLGKPSLKEELVNCEDPLFSGEWSIKRKYICHVCGRIEYSFWDMVMHKGEFHPGVLVTHTELLGSVPKSLVRTPSWQETNTEDSIPPCSKCQATFRLNSDLHRHIFECAGNTTWLDEEKTPSKRKSKRRRGVKRRLSNTPKKGKKPELPEPRVPEIFKCEFCPREFKTEGWLKNHLVTHSLPVSIPLEKLSLPSRASNNSTSCRLFKT